MKKFYFILVFLEFSILVSAQDLGGTPVEGLIPITRISDATVTQTDSISNTNPIAPTAATAAQNYVPTPTGPSTEVGITEGQLSVSLTGGANYSIPIAVPPGINGVVPQVSLAYNSQGGNGMAGYGWNISGVSAITRIPRTLFHDGEFGGINLDTNDRFALDGQRLILKSGVYGAAGAVYETENFSNIKITSLGVSPLGATYGPASFLVEYPDGSKAVYGDTANSRSVNTWSIRYWQNAQGVRISYAYILANNTLSIEYINYGNTTSLTPINQIKFIYKTRQRPEQSYVGGQSFLIDTILSEIQVSGNSVGFRNYGLEHNTTSLGYERLVSVTEKSGDNTKSYNPTVFSYESTSESISYAGISTSLSVGNINSNNSASVTGDFDGDEKMDFLLYPRTGTNKKKKYWLFSEFTTTGNFNIGYEHNVGDFEDIFPVSWLTWSNYLWSKQGWAVAKKTDTNYTFTVYSTGTVSPIYYQYEKVVSFPTHLVGTIQNCVTTYVNKIFPKKILSGDFNGDGLTDVVAIDMELESKVYGSNPSFGLYCIPVTSKIPSKKVYFVDLKRDNTTNFLTYSGELNSLFSEFEANGSQRAEVYDVNGDGKSDFLIIANGKITAYTLDSSNQLVLLWEYSDSLITNDYTKPNYKILFGDYNGDGKIDFIIPKVYNSNSYAKYTSTGKSFLKEDVTYDIPFNANFGNECPGVFHILPNDFDCDGKTDLILVKNLACPNTSGKGYISIRNYKNTGINFVSNMYATTETLSGIGAYALPVLSSSDKPNVKLEINFISNNKILNFQSQKDFGKEKLLKIITTGNGVRESITYQSLSPDSLDSNYEPVYSTNLYTEKYPQNDIRSAVNVQLVYKLEKQSASVYKKQVFKYHGAVSNVEGLGFLGFRATMRTNWHDDSTPIISTIYKTDVNLRGAPIESFSVLGLSYPSRILIPTNSFISKSINTYNMVNGIFENPLQTNKVYKLKLTQSKQFNGLDKTSVETNTEYDSYNNPLTSTTKLNEDENTVQTTISTVTYKPVSTTLPYLLGLPASKTETVSASDDVMTSEELYDYNATGLLKQIKKKGHNTPYITETNAYTTYGSINRKTITATGVSRITNYFYDTSKRFIIKSTDIEGLATTYSYNPDNGLLNSETNPYGLTTSYEYDSWFKKTKTTDYLGKTNSYNYYKEGINTKITSTGDDNSYSEELFDDLGRKIRTGIKDIQGAMSFKDYQYDIYDRNYSVSEPYTSNPTQWNTTQYDEYGRPIVATDFLGKTISVQYDKLTNTTTDSSTGNTKTAVKNAMGNVISMTEAPIGGTIRYSYFANGNLKETNYNDAITTITQDGWGRKT